ncbi:MAG TPA: hypothetical protein VHZ33_32085 [Trebonia sp.]|jgi:hypothetical protein|nr:hypothetical protein [Trebonia sp.]
MSAAVLEHPLVRDYLRRLDAACAALPAGQARELREQIVGHLDEALPADADDDEVENVALRVRVGLFTRTENVPFVSTAFVIAGTKASSLTRFCR